MRSLSSPRAVSMMIGTLAVVAAAAQAAAHFDPADALDHPVEQDDVGLHLLDQDQRFLAVAGARDRR